MDAVVASRARKILGLLGSSFASERSVAATLLRETAIANRLTVPELVAQISHAPPTARAAEPPPPKPRSAADYGSRIGFLLKRVAAGDRKISPWETNFLQNLSRIIRNYGEGRLSGKQKAVIDRLYHLVVGGRP